MKQMLFCQNLINVCEAKNDGFLIMKQRKSKSPGKYENPETIQLKLTASEYIKLKPKQCNSC